MFVELLKDFLGKKAGERIHVADAEGRQLIAAGVARALADDPVTPLVTRAIENALDGFTRNLDSAVTETLQRFGQAQGLARKHAVPAIFGDGPAGDPRRCFGD
jgi:hypothetical protein